MLISMKKATLFALKHDKEELLLSLQRCGEWMVIEPDESESVRTEQAAQDVVRTQNAIKFLAAHDKTKKPMFSDRESVGYSEFMSEHAQAAELSAQADDVSAAISAAQSELSSAKATIAQLEPWMTMELPLNVLPTKFVKFVVGYIDEEKTGELVNRLSGSSAVELYGLSSDGRASMVAYHIDDEVEVREALNELGYAEAVLPRMDCSSSQAVSRLKEQCAASEAKLVDLKAQAEKLAARKSELMVLYDRQVADRDREATRTKDTQSSFCLSGWVRSDRVETIRAAVESVTDAYDLSFDDPEEGEVPPTIAQNNAFVTPFESVTDLYSRPAYGRLDPNPIMTPFYVLFFGMMVSDAGYGVVLTILTILFQKLLKPRGTMKKLAQVIMYGGMSTILWGAIYGGYFGIQGPALLIPMEQPLEMLVLCFALGLVHIFAGMIVNMYICFKDGRPMDAVYDQLSWMMLIVGLLMLVGGGVIALIGKIMAAVGALIILLFAGRASKGAARIIGGLGSLYGITSYLGDVLSYSRLFALGLATGVIAMVVNILCKMMMGSVIGYIIAIGVLIGGHLFNIALNTLGAFVHTARLQYIEFFGKFYESGGRTFKPLAINTKYVDVKKDAA